ncbi:MAG: response regulator [Longimicrobiales bacterium]
MQSTPPSPPSSEAGLILVVEDNPDHALLVQVAAGRVDRDAEVRVLPNGEEALAYLAGTGRFADRQAHPLPGLVILDLLLPGMGGFDVLHWIEDRPDLAGHVPVVVLTSSMNPADRDRALESGASGYYVKPPDVMSLGETIRAILEGWRS